MNTLINTEELIMDAVAIVANAQSIERGLQQLLALLVKGTTATSVNFAEYAQDVNQFTVIDDCLSKMLPLVKKYL